MICFRDMTFCSSACSTEACRRRWTPKLAAEADAWWKGDGAPVAFADFAPNCAQHTPEESGDERPA